MKNVFYVAIVVTGMFGISTVFAKEQSATGLGDKAKISTEKVHGEEFTKVVDEVDGHKIVCYSVTNPSSSQSGKSISCLKLD